MTDYINSQMKKVVADGVFCLEGVCCVSKLALIVDNCPSKHTGHDIQCRHACQMTS